VLPKPLNEADRAAKTTNWSWQCCQNH